MIGTIVISEAIQRVSGSEGSGSVLLHEVPMLFAVVTDE
jgi:hypothetical protein